VDVDGTKLLMTDFAKAPAIRLEKAMDNGARSEHNYFLFLGSIFWYLVLWGFFLVW